MWFKKTLEYILTKDEFLIINKTYEARSLYIPQLAINRTIYTLPVSTCDIANLLLNVLKDHIKLSYENTKYVWKSTNKKNTEIVDEEYLRYFIQTEFVDDLKKEILVIANETIFGRCRETTDKKIVAQVILNILVILKSSTDWKYIIKDMKLITRFSSK